MRLRGEIGMCDLCLHPKIRHIKDGSGSTCIVCTWIVEQKKKGQPVVGMGGPPHGGTCTRRFTFMLNQAEREQAQKAPKDSFEPWIMCAVCYYNWQQHEGFLCPSGDSTFIPLLDNQQPFLVTKEN